MKLFLFAGEQSGDLLGGNLARALKSHAPSLDLFGVAGPEMRQEGVRCTTKMEAFQVMGIVDVLKALPRLYTHFRAISRTILRENPEGVVLIDYPDFNMRLAKRLRKKGYQGKIIHYVCPSVWAWRKNRVYALAATLDRLLSILPFEETCFKGTTLPVSYVGHPLIATLKNYAYAPEWKLEKPTLALFPGSRRHEVEHNLALQWEVAKRFLPDYTIAVSVARPDLKELITSIVGEEALLVSGDHRYELMHDAKAALATSGTVVLELGLHHVPTVVTYRLPFLNYYLGRYAFRILLPYYTLVNLICEEEVYPEFIHKTIDPEEVYLALKRFVDTPTLCPINKLDTHLSTQNASDVAAKEVLHEMSLP